MDTFKKPFLEPVGWEGSPVSQMGMPMLRGDRHSRPHSWYMPQSASVWLQSLGRCHAFPPQRRHPGHKCPRTTQMDSLSERSEKTSVAFHNLQLNVRVCPSEWNIQHSHQKYSELHSSVIQRIQRNFNFLMKRHKDT